MSDDERVKILLVDDQPARLLTYEAVLGDLGHDLVMASSGLEALERLMRDEFAVIVLDVNMPGMDGFETAALVHQHPRFRRTPIVFATGLHVTDTDRLRGYEVGAIDYVPIPIQPQILRGKISVLVELYKKRRELERANKLLQSANTALASANHHLNVQKSRELEHLNEILDESRLRLERLDRRKDAFLAKLAHALRNPLMPLRLGVELLRRSSAVQGDAATALEMMERQVLALGRLVDDLMDVARIRRGELRLQTEAVDLAEAVRSAVDATRPAIEAREHALEVVLPDEPLTLEADPVRITQVIGNLLDNAAKYTPAGGRIRVSAERERGGDGAAPSAILRVKDDGRGIPRPSLASLFQLFVQGEDGSATPTGLGVGLALVKQLVELHRGEVSAHSDGPGTGAEFTVRLPLAEQPAPSTRPLDAGAGTRGAPRRILLVDDSPDITTGLAALLRQEGNEVRAVNDGATALDVGPAFLPDVVILDLGMPRMDGFEVALLLRREAWGESVLLIALSGWGEDHTRARARDAGFDAHLIKPAGIGAIQSVLASARRASVRSTP